MSFVWRVWWRSDLDMKPVLVGTYRLNLPGLIAAGIIHIENSGYLRLNVYHRDRELFLAVLPGMTRVRVARLSW